MEEPPPSPIPQAKPSKTWLWVFVVIGLLVLTGYFVFASIGKKRTLVVTPISPVPEYAKGWNVYRDVKFGIEFRHPNLKIFITDYENPNDKNDLPSIVINPADLTISLLSTSAAKKYVGDLETQLGKDMEEISIASYKGRGGCWGTDVVTDEGPVVNCTYIVSSGSHNLKIDYSKPSPENLAEKIIATMSFIDNDAKIDTAVWKSYTDQDLGFSIKYPPSWSVEKKVFELKHEAWNTVFDETISGALLSSGENSLDKTEVEIRVGHPSRLQYHPECPFMGHGTSAMLGQYNKYIAYQLRNDAHTYFCTDGEGGEFLWGYKVRARFSSGGNLSEQALLFDTLLKNFGKNPKNLPYK